MQLRLGLRARATTDLDVLFRGRVEDWLDAFDSATAAASWNGFTVGRKRAPTQIDIPGIGYKPWRVPVQIRYEGREFASVALEVAIDETAAAHHELLRPEGIELAKFAIESPGLIPVLDVPYQIAQKLHACTEYLPGGNERVRDLVDIWLLEAFIGPADLTTVRRACVETFARRQEHAWPPAVVAGPSWGSEYQLLISEYPDAPPTLASAVVYLADLVSRIDSSGTPSSIGVSTT